MPGDSINISWSPSSKPIQNIVLLSTGKEDDEKYVLKSDKVNGDPINTSGKFNYTFENHFIPSGSYYVGLSLPGTDAIAARSSKKIKVENRPSLFFGTQDGEVNSVAVSPGDSVTLEWRAESVKKCKASSFPANSKWKKTLAASGTKTLRVLVPTTFYLSCKNNLGEITAGLEVNTHTPERSTARIVPSTTFIGYNFSLGTTQQQALSYSDSISIFNSSAIQQIYYRIVTEDKPDWINTGYNTSQLVLPPNGTASIGASVDPSRISRSGTYVWNLKLDGNFSNSPLSIPITMTITR